MPIAKTLFELFGADTRPARIDDAALVLIDYQNEYLAGPVALGGAPAAVAVAARLLAAARGCHAPIFHVVHRGAAGGPFDLAQDRGRIIAALTPEAHESVIEKQLPNGFAKTDLAAALAATGRTEVIVAGFMTHNCVSSTARAALDLGYRVTIDAQACATRALPDGQGGEIDASAIHRTALVALSDRTAMISWTPIAPD